MENYHNSSEKSNVFKYAMLATKISQTINQIDMNKKVDESGYAIIKRGTELLTRILEGSCLIEKKTITGVKPSQEGLFVYGHALSAFEKLKLSMKDINSLLYKYREEIISLSAKEELSKDQLNELKRFFTELGNLFYEDLQQEIFKEPKKQSLNFCYK